jgi:hypothetical protein
MKIMDKRPSLANLKYRTINTHHKINQTALDSLKEVKLLISLGIGPVKLFVQRVNRAVE